MRLVDPSTWAARTPIDARAASECRRYLQGRADALRMLRFFQALCALAGDRAYAALSNCELFFGAPLAECAVTVYAGLVLRLLSP